MGVKKNWLKPDGCDSPGWQGGVVGAGRGEQKSPEGLLAALRGFALDWAAGPSLEHAQVVRGSVVALLKAGGDHDPSPPAGVAGAVPSILAIDSSMIV